MNATATTAKAALFIHDEGVWKRIRFLSAMIAHRAARKFTREGRQVFVIECNEFA